MFRFLRKTPGSSLPRKRVWLTIVVIPFVVVVLMIGMLLSHGPESEKIAIKLDKAEILLKCKGLKPLIKVSDLKADGGFQGIFYFYIPNGTTVHSLIARRDGLSSYLCFKTTGCYYKLQINCPK